MSFHHELFFPHMGKPGMGKIISPAQKRTYLHFIRSDFGKISQREIARRLGLGKTSINRWSRELGLKHQKHTVNEHFFDELNKSSSYLLGYIYADGNIAWDAAKGYYALTITAAEKDKSHLENLRLVLTSTKPLLYSAKTKSYRLIVNNKKLVSRLLELGVTPRKSLTVTFPTFMPPEHLKHFIRGVVDGDGTVYYLKRKRSPYFSIRIYSGSKKFLVDLVQSIKMLFGIDGKVRKANKSTYGVDYTCSRAKKLGDILYSDTTLYLQRKYEVYKTNILGGNKNE